MYTVTCDGQILHDPRLGAERLVLLDPKLTLELNKHGSFAATLAPVHPLYDAVHKLKSEIVITQDGERLWAGRVLNDTQDMQKLKTLDCEGELAYLLDSIQPFHEYHNISVTNYLAALIANHNAQVDPEQNNPAKRFALGTVTVTDSNDSLYRYSNYESTWDCIQEKLLDRLGGYLKVRYENGTRYLDYLTDAGGTGTQTITFGENLLDLKRTVKGDEIATVLVPLGKELDTDSQTASAESVKDRLTIKDVNGGSIYLEDAEAIALYGRIVAVVTFDDVTTASALKTKGLAELAARVYLSDTIELTAVDLHLLHVDVEKIRLGDSIRIISAPHGIDTYMVVSKMEIDLADPTGTVITLGRTVQTLTDVTNTASVRKVIESYGYGQQITNNVTQINEIHTSLVSIDRRVDDAATTAYVDEQIAAIQQPAGYATESYVDGQVDDLQALIDALTARVDALDGGGQNAE